jgi:hypothetical protein
LCLIEKNKWFEKIYFNGPQEHPPTLLGPDEDVGDVLVLAKERDVQQDLERFGIGGQNHELGLTPVQGLGRFVGTLAHLQQKNPKGY